MSEERAEYSGSGRDIAEFHRYHEEQAGTAAAAIRQAAQAERREPQIHRVAITIEIGDAEQEKIPMREQIEIVCTEHAIIALADPLGKAITSTIFNMLDNIAKAAEKARRRA